VKKYSLILLLLAFISLNLNAQKDSQGFERSQSDTWNYTSNIPFYSLNNNTDLWNNFSGSNGRVDGAYKGTSYMAGRDLDNPYSESVTGQASPEHILTFETMPVYGAPSEISFRLNYVLFDKGDYIYYEIKYDNGTNWNSPDVHVDVFKTSQNGNFSTNGWEEFVYTIPSGKSHVRFRIGIYQNGNAYIGLDSFQFTSQALSTSDNKIEGFSFGPNPTKDILRLHAKVILDRATVYNVFGRRILSKTGDSNEIALDMSHLSSGIYLTKVESQGLSQTIKVVKN